jgi:SAM-dependent methyltransferase
MDTSMAIGSVLANASNTFSGKLLTLLLGTSDIHSHTRLWPILTYFKGRRMETLKILEIGCGTGSVLIEICSIGRNFTATGVDNNRSSVEQANRRLRRMAIDHGIKFLSGDALEWDNDETYDVIILADVLEHLSDTSHVMDMAYRRLRPNGTLLVSVPTPMYSRVFGQEFHELVGHVKDGYTKEKLLKECSTFRVVNYSYNTGPLFWLPCALSYRLIRRLNHVKLRGILNYCLVPFASLDLWQPEKWSCSLFLQFVPRDGQKASASAAS